MPKKYAKNAYSWHLLNFKKSVKIEKNDKNYMNLCETK